jgi:hypothetical protein
MFVANGFVILLIFQLLFMFRNPGTEAVGVFQVLLAVSLITFVAISIILSYVGINEDTDDADRPIALWAAMTMFVCGFFFILPARAVVRIVTYPAIQKEDKGCVTFCIVAIWLYGGLHVGRAVWNFTHYCGINYLQELVYRYSWKDPGVRAFNGIFLFLFDVLPASLAIAGVYLLRKHDMLFNETVHFAALM